MGMLAAHPPTGAGFGQFEAESFRYQSEDLLAERGRALGMTTAFGEAHNELLQHAAETGLLGLVLLAAGIVVAWRRGRSDTGSLPARVPLLLTATLIALAQFPLHQAAPAAQWAVLAALALPGLTPPPLPQGVRKLLLGCGLALAVLAIGALAWARIVSLGALQRSQVLVEVLRRGAPASRVAPLRTALATVTRLQRFLPYDWQAENTLGNLAMEAGDFPAAADHFGAALALAERPELRYNLAMAKLAQGDEGGGMAELILAVKLNPSMVKQVTRPDLRARLRTALAAESYTTRHPWVFGEEP
jgi:tetratricopeptide (TPR) repeat protein